MSEAEIYLNEITAPEYAAGFACSLARTHFVITSVNQGEEH